MSKLVRKNSGFTLVEATVMLVVLSIVAVAAGVGLNSIAQGPYADETRLATSNYLVSKIEQLKGTAFASMAGGSDTVTINGTTYTRTWTVANANPNGSGNQVDFDQVSVTIGSQTLTTWITNP